MQRRHACLSAATAAVLAALLLTSPATPAATAYVSATGLRFGVTDLDENDGIEAGFTWNTEPPTFTEWQASAGESGGAWIRTEYGLVPGWMTPISAAVALPQGEAHAAVGADSMAVRGASFMSGQPFYAYASSSTDGDGLLVAPNTALTVSMDIFASATVNPVCCEVAFIETRLYGWSEAESFAGNNFSIWVSTEPGGLLTDTQSGVSSVTLLNESDAAKYYGLWIFTQTSGFGKVDLPPVPEPASGLLMLAGAAALAAAVRRRH